MGDLLKKLIIRLEKNLEENKPIPKGYVELLDVLIKKY